jgi:hypothetical protein
MCSLLVLTLVMLLLLLLQGVDPTNASNATLLDAFSGEIEEDEDECIGVAVNDTSYVPASLLKRLGYKIVKAEEGGEWGVVRREGAAEEVRRCCPKGYDHAVLT